MSIFWLLLRSVIQFNSWSRGKYKVNYIMNVMEEVKTKDKIRSVSIFEEVAGMGHEQVVFCNDEATGLKAIIGIHNTVLGPALGGTRFWKVCEWPCRKIHYCRGYEHENQ